MLACACGRRRLTDQALAIEQYREILSELGQVLDVAPRESVVSAARRAVKAREDAREELRNVRLGRAELERTLARLRGLETP
jgi:hypothetical protein